MNFLLSDDPLVVAVLDGKPIKMFLEDEDDFAMLAEDLFTDLDTEDTGKISKKKIRNALACMGVNGHSSSFRLVYIFILKLCETVI